MAWSTEGGATHRQVVLNYITKQTGQAMGSKPLISIPPESLLQFLVPPDACPGFPR